MSRIGAAAAAIACVLGLAERSRAEEAKATLTIAIPPDRAAENEQQKALAHGEVEAKAGEGEALGVDPDVARAERRPSAGGGLRGTFGRVFTEHAPDGWYGRLELEAFTAGAFEGHGPVGGVLIGGELWLAPDAGGGGMPMSVWLGYRTPGLFTAFGVGFEAFEIDKVEGDTGFGLYAPFGTATIGMEIAGMRLLADGRALYRWQWGAPDRAQIQVGITMVHFIESPLRKHRYEAGGHRRGARGKFRAD